MAILRVRGVDTTTGQYTRVGTADGVNVGTSITGAVEAGTLAITSTDATTAATAGAAITVFAGDGNTSGDGGDISNCKYSRFDLDGREVRFLKDYLLLW